MPTYVDDGFAPPAPVAKVVLRHPVSGEGIPDVPMLIDSGRMRPCCPLSPLRPSESRERVSVINWRRSTATTNESEAVQAVLVFLGKSFRGRFLQVDAEVGVLGRNVLNRVRLLLDGPALKWEER